MESVHKNDVDVSCMHGRPQGGGARVGGCPPLKIKKKNFRYIGGLFAPFSPHGGLFATFSRYGETFSLCKGPLHHVGAFLLHFSSCGEPFCLYEVHILGLPPPTHTKFLRAPMDVCSLTQC